MSGRGEKIRQYIHKQSATRLIMLGMILGIGAFFAVQEIDAVVSRCSSDLDYVRHVEDCDRIEEKVESFGSLEQSVSQMIETYKKTGKATRVGVFVRDLKTTRFFGINENHEFVMASLLKIPLAITGYKLAEVDPSVLDAQITFTEKQNQYNKQLFPVPNRMVVGNKYPIGEVIERAIIYSDNAAAQMLLEFYAPGFFSKILSALNISIIRQEGSEEVIITARSFGNVFRSLYNSSYLTRSYSNYILDILTKTTYKGGATSKLPPDVKVAHKFAERSFYAPDDKEFKNPLLRQLHECGIVYVNKGQDPYSFCILTEGKDYRDLEQVQADISFKIYSVLAN